MPDTALKSFLACSTAQYLIHGDSLGSLLNFGLGLARFLEGQEHHSNGRPSGLHPSQRRQADPMSGGILEDTEHQQVRRKDQPLPTTRSGTVRDAPTGHTA